MPRDSGGVFSLPSGYLATPGTTILSTQHNAPLEDIAQALTDSLPRNGAAAMTGPLNSAFAGNFGTLSSAGSATFGGAISVGATATFGNGVSLDGAAGTSRNVAGRTASKLRWVGEFGNTGAETGANAGSDFALNRYNDAGAYIDTPLVISRATGNAVIAHNEAVVGNLSVGGTVNASGTITAAAPLVIGGVTIFGTGDIAGSIFGASTYLSAFVIDRSRVRLAAQAFYDLYTPANGDYAVPTSCVVTGVRTYSGISANSYKSIGGLFYRGLQQPDFNGNWYNVASL